MTPAGGVFGGEINDLKTVFIQKCGVIFWIKAGVINRRPLDPADPLSVFGTGCEHQRGAWRGMGGENREHGALIRAAEVEEEFAACAILENVTSKYLKCNTRRRTSAPAPESA